MKYIWEITSWTSLAIGCFVAINNPQAATHLLLIAIFFQLVLVKEKHR